MVIGFSAPSLVAVFVGVAGDEAAAARQCDDLPLSSSGPIQAWVVGHIRGGHPKETPP